LYHFGFKIPAKASSLPGMIFINLFKKEAAPIHECGYIESGETEPIIRLKKSGGLS
jgi:hypothetical protein